MEEYRIRENRYYYNTEQRILPLSVCSCGMDHYPDGYIWGPGFSTHYDINYIESGTGSYFINNREHLVKPGDVLITYPNDIQYVKSDDDVDWTIYWIGFDGKDAVTLLTKLGVNENNPIVNVGTNNELSRLHRMMYAQSGNKLSDTLNMTGILYQFFGVLFRLSGCDNLTTPDLLQKALDYIHENLDREIRVDELCEYLNVSQSWLYRKFVDSVGYSPNGYIINQRILNSCKLFQDTDLSITEIAYKCGFSDPLYFSRVFRKIMRKSPREYRNSSHNE